jgi:hypothetical protein
LDRDPKGRKKILGVFESNVLMIIFEPKNREAITQFVFSIERCRVFTNKRMMSTGHVSSVRRSRKLLN